MADENIIDTEIPEADTGIEQPETTVPPATRIRRGTATRRQPALINDVPVDELFKTTGVPTNDVPVDELFKSGATTPQKKNSFEWPSALDLQSRWAKPPESYYGSSSFAERDLPKNDLIKQWMIDKEMHQKQMQGINLTPEQALKSIQARAPMKSSFDLYRETLKGFGVDNPEEFVLGKTDTELQDWYKLKQKELDTAETAAYKAEAKGEGLDPGDLMSPLVIDPKESPDTIKPVFANKRKDLALIQQNLFAPKIASSMEGEDALAVGLRQLELTKPAEYEHLIKAQVKGPERTWWQDITGEPRPQTIADFGDVNDPKFVRSWMSKTLKEDPAMLTGILSEGELAEIEGMGYSAKAINSVQQGMKLADVYDVAYKEREQKLFDINNRRKVARTQGEMEALNIAEQQANDKFVSNPDVQQFLQHQRNFIDQLQQLSGGYLKKYPTVLKREADKQAVRQKFDDAGVMSRWMLDSPIPGATGSYGIAGSAWKGLAGLGKEAVKFGNSVDAFLGIQDKSQVFFNNKEIDEKFGTHYFLPEKGQPNQVTGYEDVPPELLAMAKRLGLPEGSVDAFGKPITELNGYGVVMAAAEGTGNMIGQAILTRGIGGALESAAFRMGDAAILRGALANPVLSKVVTLGPKAREVAGIMGSTYAVTYYQNYQQAIDAGLPEGEASTYANLSSLGSAATELINPDVKYLNKALGRIPNEEIHALNKIAKNLEVRPNQRVLNFMKEYLKHTGSETVEEVLDTFKQHVLDAAYNINTTGMGLAEDMGQTALITAISMMPMGIFGASGHTSKLNRSALWYAGSHPQAIQNYYLDRINKETDPNKVKSLQAEANKAMTTANTMKEIISYMPEENAVGRKLTEDEKMKMAQAEFNSRKLTRDATTTKSEALKSIAEENAVKETAKVSDIASGTAPAYIVNGESMEKEQFIHFLQNPDYTKHKEDYKLEVYNDPEVAAMKEKATEGVKSDPEKRQALDIATEQQLLKKQEIEAYNNKLTTDLTPDEREETTQRLGTAQRELKMVEANIKQIKKAEANAPAQQNVKYNRVANIQQPAEQITPEDINNIPAGTAQAATTSVQIAPNAPLPWMPKVNSQNVNMPNPVGEKVKETFNSAPKVISKNTRTVILPGQIPGIGRKLKGRVALVPHWAITPSHNPETFANSEGFPLLENGQNPNDRNYQLPSNQQQVIQHAIQYDQRAIDNMPTITPNGVVIDGNDRTMSGQLAVQSERNFSDEDYLAELKNRLGDNGFTIEDYNHVAAVGHPRLVFITEDDVPMRTETFQAFNISKEKAKSVIESAVGVRRRLESKEGRRVMEIIMDEIDHALSDPDDTIAKLYTKRAALKKIFNALVDGGILQTNEVANYYDVTSNTITENGKDYIETLLLSNIVDEKNLVLLNQPGVKSYRQKLIGAIRNLTAIENLDNKDLRLAENINSAIQLKYDLTQFDGDLSSFLAQQSLPGMSQNVFTGNDVSVYYNLEENAKEFKEFTRKYLSLANIGGTAQGVMFAEEKTSNRAEVIERLAQNFTDEQQRNIQQAEAAYRGQQPGSAKENAENLPGGTGEESTAASQSEPTQRRSAEQIPAASTATPTAEESGLAGEERPVDEVAQRIPESTTALQEESVDEEDEEEISDEADTEEIARQEWQDELNKSPYYYGQYGGTASDTFYIKKSGSDKVEREIKFTDREQGLKKVYQWMDEHGGTKILEKYNVLQGEDASTLPEKEKGEQPTLFEPQPAFNTKATADKVRNLKVDISKLSGGGAQSNVLGLPIGIWNSAMDLIATTIEAGGTVADAVRRGLNYIERNHRGTWNKKGFEDRVMNELGVMGINVNGQDVVADDVTKEFAPTIDGFYSDMEQTVLDAKRRIAPAKAWSAMIGNSDEAKWTGVKDWLNSFPPGKLVTKQEILKFMENNRIQVVEVKKETKERDFKSNAEKMEDIKTVFRNAGYDISLDMSGEVEIERRGNLEQGIQTQFIEDPENELPADLYEKAQEFHELNEDRLGDRSRDETQYSGYQLPGPKTDYKEVLVTLPNKAKQFGMPESLQDSFGHVKYAKETYGVNSTEYDSMKKSFIRQAIDEGLSRRDALTFLTDNKMDRQDFRSNHFNEPNILVHLRMNTRTDMDGKKVLFLEEIQSDWAQKGRKKGFLTEERKKINQRISDLWDEERKADGEVNRIMRKVRDEVDGEVSISSELNAGNEKLKAAVEKARQIKQERFALVDTIRVGSSAVEDPITPAPFVTETTQWTKLGLKVALKEAAQQNADKIAWTTGEQQRDRYDLSQHIGQIMYKKTGPDAYEVTVFKPKDELQETSIYNPERNVILHRTMSADELSNTVGEEIANKIINDEGKADEDPELTEIVGKTIEGEGLKIGGTGMIGYYGSPEKGVLGIVGNVAKSLFKQEPKTTEINLKTPPPYLRAIEAPLPGVEDQSTQHSINVTPALKTEAETGLPLFSDIKGRGKQMIGTILQESDVQYAKEIIPQESENITAKESLANGENAETYTTQEGDPIHFRQLSLDFNAPASNVQREGSEGQSNLPRVANGEWSSVERQFKAATHFDFTTRTNKVETLDDVAFIFRSLENEAIEQSFIVYMNDKGEYFTQWLSMGGIASTVVDPLVAIGGISQIENPTKAVFVHNHPSGNLQQSEADVNALNKFKIAMTNFKLHVEGIIINLRKGEYAIIDDFGSKKQAAPQGEAIAPVEVKTFSRAVFASNYNPDKIIESADIARHLSKMRYGVGDKMGILVLNRAHEIMGNFFLNPGPDLARDILIHTAKFGGKSVIAYGNMTPARSEFLNKAKEFKDLKTNLKAADVTFLDYVEVAESKGNLDSYYRSMADEGELHEPVPAAQAPQQNIADRGKQLADFIRQGKIKISGLQSNIAGIPIALYNAALDTIATAIEAGSTLGQAINKAIQDHKLREQPAFSQGELINRLEAMTGQTVAPGEISAPVTPQQQQPVQQQPAATPQALSETIRGIKTPAGYDQPTIFGMPTRIYNEAIDMVANSLAEGNNLVDALDRAIAFIQKNGGGWLNAFRGIVNDAQKGERLRGRTQVGGEREQRLTAARQINQAYEETGNGPVQSEPSSEAEGGNLPEDVGIDVKAIDAARELLGFPPIKKSPTKTRAISTEEGLNALVNGINIIRVMQKISKGQGLTEQEANAMNAYIAGLQLVVDDANHKYQEAIKSKDPAAISQMRAVFEDAKTNFAKASEVHRLQKTKVGRELNTYKSTYNSNIFNDYTLTNMLLRVQHEANDGANTTEQQQAQTEGLWSGIKSAEGDYKAHIEAQNEKKAREQAEQEVERLKKQREQEAKNQGKTSTPRGSKKYNDAKLMIKNLLRKKSIKPDDLESDGVVSEPSQNYGNSGPVPYLSHDTLREITPHVKDMMNGLIDDFVNGHGGPGGTVAGIVEYIKKDLAEDLPQLTERNIIDMLTGFGEVKPPKRTRTQLENEKARIRRELKMAQELEGLKNSPEPRDVKSRKNRNDRIKKLEKSLQYEEGSTTTEALDRRKRFYANQLKRILKRINDRDFGETKTVPVPLDAEGERLSDAVQKAKADFEYFKEQERLKNLTAREKRMYRVDQVLGTLKALKATIDLSHLLRQGFILGVKDPRQWWRSARQSVKWLKNKQDYDKWHKDEIASDFYKKYILPFEGPERLFIADIKSATMTAREEVFTTNLLKDVPILGTAMTASERAYSGGLNVLRMGVYKKGVGELEAAGMTMENAREKYASLANYINHATGRGDLGDFEESAKGLNRIFYSARFVASRINTINYMYWKKLEPEQRKEMAIDLLRFIGVNVALLAIAGWGGADVEKDPTDAKFGTIEVGDTKVDFLAGYKSYINFFSRGIASLIGKREVNSEKMKEMGLEFQQGKLAPVTGLIFNNWFGQNSIGEPTNLYSKEGIVNNLWGFLPMQGVTTIELFKGHDPATATILTALSAGGAGVSTYSTKKATRRGSGFKSKFEKISIKD